MECEPQTRVTSRGCLPVFKQAASNWEINLGSWSSGASPPLTLASCSVKWEGWSFHPSFHPPVCPHVEPLVRPFILSSSPGWALGTLNGEIPVLSIHCGEKQEANGDMGRGLWARPPVCVQGLLVNPHQGTLMNTGGEMAAGEEAWAEEQQERNKLFWKAAGAGGVSDWGKALG